MGFKKTGDALSRPTEVRSPQELRPQVGDEKDSLIWDGARWITKAAWQAKQAERS